MALSGTTTGLTSSASNFEYTTTNIPAFLSKLWTLVEDEKYNELIAWDPVINYFKNNAFKYFFVLYIFTVFIFYTI